jgi:glycosyltransferase involved in cell wall biosynthesis
LRRAAIISPDPSSDSGGVERTCTLLSGVLQQQGWDTTIVGPGSWPGKWHFRAGVDYLSASCSATVAARAQQPDLIISNGYLGMGRSRQTPRIHVYHGTMVGDTRAEGPAIPRREHLRRTVAAGVCEAIAGRATRLVAVSDAVATEARRYYGAHADAVIPNGIDTNSFAPRDRTQARARLKLKADARMALFVGRIQHRKGGDLIAEAVAGAGYELMVAGATAVPGAHHLGLLTPAELPEAYAAADCVVFPSRYEACSLVILEALACGRPLLTTRIGWMQTLLQAVPAYDALCVNPTVADLTARLIALDSIDTADLSARARSFVLANNSLERYAERWRTLIDSVTA